MIIFDGETIVFKVVRTPLMSIDFLRFGWSIYPFKQNERTQKDAYFWQSSWFSIWTLLQLVRRYGWVPLRYANLAKREFLKKFRHIYTHLNNRESYSSPRDMLEGVGLFDLTQKTAREVIMVSHRAVYMGDLLLYAVLQHVNT